MLNVAPDACLMVKYYYVVNIIIKNTNFTRPVSISNSHPSQKTRTHSPHIVIAKATPHSKLALSVLQFSSKKKKK